MVWSDVTNACRTRGLADARRKTMQRRLRMKRNTLFAALALALGGVGAIGTAQAQDFGSWYVAPRLGAVVPDSNRTTKVSGFGGIGVGVWVNPNFAVDFEYGINNADFKNSSPRNTHQWESVQLDVAARYFFGDIGALRHKAYSGSLLQAQGQSDSGGWDPMALLGVGIQYGLSDRLAFRGEVAARYDHDNNSLNNALAFNPALGGVSHPFKRQSGFTDALVTVGLTYSFGGAPAAPPPPPPAPPPPPPAAPPPPPPAPIDLRGVEF